MSARSSLPIAVLGVGVDSDELEVLKLSTDVWERLGAKEKESIAVRAHGQTSQAKSLICWAIHGSDIESGTIAINRRFLEKHPEVFATQSSIQGTIKLEVNLVKPVSLEEVILVAQSVRAITFAQDRREKVVETFSGDKRLVRQDEIISLFEQGPDSPPSALQFLVAMAQPVHQGLIDPATTKVIIVQGTDINDTDLSSSPVSSREIVRSDDELDSDLDESFLLNTLPSPNIRIGSDTGMTNGLHNQHAFTARVLPYNIPLPHDEFREMTVLLKLTDIARLGIFSGDWVVVTDAEKRSRMRLARAIGTELHSELLESSTLYAPPVFIHNLSMSDENMAKVLVQRCSFGQQLPPIPTAHSVTLARIASPVSTSKQYQTIIFQALRRYFSTGRHLLKKDDIVALPLVTTSAPLINGLEEADKKQESTIEELMDTLLEEHPTPNEIAYFQVTNLEHSLVRLQGDTTPDTHFAAVMGELGCWMDSSTTRLIQGGIEHSRVPELDGYLGIERDWPRLTDLVKGSTLCRNGTPFSNLKNVFRAAMHPEAVKHGLSLSALIIGGRASGKRTTVRWVAQDVGFHVMEIDCYDIADDTEVKTEGTLRARFEQAEAVTPSVLLLRNIEALAKSNQKLETGKEPSVVSVIQECIKDAHLASKKGQYPLLVVATTRDPDLVPLGILACFKHQFTIPAPDEDQRQVILANLLQQSTFEADVSLPSIAAQTAAMVAGDLVDLVSRVAFVAAARISDLSYDLGVEVESLHQAGFGFTGADFDAALGQARAAFSANIGAPSIPKVAWDDVGGLTSVKSDIMDTIQLPLEHPELFADGMKKRSGILLFGPPGTGKTLLAKAVATSFSLNFFSVKGPELLNMYIGESEANVRRVFQRARDARPCVIFFDELDSVAPKRGNHGDSGGVMDRIVSQLLAELDGMSSGAGGDVFVIGATNRPDLLDPALLRPGRFDKLLYLGVSDTHEAQLKIIEALTRKFHLDDAINLKAIADQCPFNYTGADFYALCSDAMLKAMTRKAESVDRKIGELNSQPHSSKHVYPITPQYYLAEMASYEDTEIIVAQEDFEAALEELTPSVSQAEMEHYRLVQQRFAENGGTDLETSNQEVDDTVLAPPVTVDRKGKGRAVE